MIPAAFEYYTPGTLSEAISLLEQHGYEAKVLAGGHSLIPMMKLRLAEPAHLIDINEIADLSYIREEDGMLKIGALTREVMLEESELIRTKYPLIYEATQLIADPQVRNMATVGGNLAHGDPGNDHPAVMLALGAQVVVAGSSDTRTIPIDEFFVDLYTTALEPDEILTEIQVPVPGPSSSGAYLKLERKVGDYATVAVGAQVTLADDGTCEEAGIGLTNVSYVPLKATDAEESLRGQALTDEAIQEAARLAAEASNPSSDLRGDEEYKRSMVEELTARALRRAAERAKGGQ